MKLLKLAAVSEENVKQRLDLEHKKIVQKMSGIFLTNVIQRLLREEFISPYDGVQRSSVIVDIGALDG